METGMYEQKMSSLRHGALTALALLLVTSIPQISLCVGRGLDWNGAYAYTDPDELAYSAYLNSLIHGKPRRNNPERPKHSQGAESIFSIQFIPPYAVALGARLFGMSASTSFIVLTPTLAFITSLVLFGFLLKLTDDRKTAAMGTMLILICGVLASENLLTADNHYAVFSFLRRYVPALPFPIMIVFLSCLWQAYSQQETTAVWWALGAAGAFGLLVYSYFFIWTGVAAWFLCFTSIWLIARQEDRKHVLKMGSICAVLFATALLPYFWMLAGRLQSKDAVLGLVLTRSPDLFRFTEIIGALVLIALAVGVSKGTLNWRTPGSLFVISCAILPFVVFNQQILTGRSLQPFHYEQFVVNYFVLIAVVITDRMLWNLLHKKPWFVVALGLVVGSTLGVKATATHWRENVMRDEAIPLFKKLEGEAALQAAPGAALFDKTLLSASSQTTCSSLPVLWSLYSYTYGDMSRAEEHERLYQHFYYLGVDGPRLEGLLNGDSLFRGAVFGLTRVNTTLTEQFQPITSEEIRAEVEQYSKYVSAFSEEHAKRWPLSFVVLVKDKSYDLSHLDRWYDRDGGETIGTSTVYRVRLRPDKSSGVTADN
jgi:hypothetical protein